MAGTRENRWVVLLNKSPKGPLGADEINALLEKKILRRNDIAYQLPADDDSKSPTEWKLLWQFPEFNRRKEPILDPNTAINEVDERRRAEPVQEIKHRTLSDVPPELLNIEPEDLIPKSSAMNVNLEREEKTAILDLGEEEDFGPTFPVKWAFAGLALVLVLTGGWMFYSTSSDSTNVAAPQALTPTPASANRAPERRATMTRPSVPVTTPEETAPSRRSPAETVRAPEPEESDPDRGEIAEEEGDGEDRETAENTQDDPSRPGSPANLMEPRRNITGNPNDPMAKNRDPRMRDRRKMRPQPMSGDEMMDENGGDETDKEDGEPAPDEE